MESCVNDLMLIFLILHVFTYIYDRSVVGVVLPESAQTVRRHHNLPLL